MIADGAAHWKAKKQSIVADSTMVAEYVALWMAGSDTMMVKNLLNELGFDIDKPILLEDNTAAEECARTGSGKKRARHLEVKYHYSQHLVQEGHIGIGRVDTKHQAADIQTKGTIPAAEFAHKREIQGVMVVPPDDDGINTDA